MLLLATVLIDAVDDKLNNIIMEQPQRRHCGIQRANSCNNWMEKLGCKSKEGSKYSAQFSEMAFEL